jgi:phytoene synthase
MVLEKDYARCSDLAHKHYENFPVGRLIAPELRPHVHAIYAFARTADDIADEGYGLEDSLSEPQRLAALDAFRQELRTSLAGPADGPNAWIFGPLKKTTDSLDIPASLYEDLLSAFRQDIQKRRYADHAEVLEYCRRSADPVGRLVLMVHGYRDEELFRLSDSICTALQLANFWQDVSVDLQKDRIYLSLEDMQAFGFDEQLLFGRQATPAFRDCLRLQVDRAQALFDAGRSLSARLEGKLSLEIRLTWLGGVEILRKIRSQNYDTLSRRPRIGAWDMVKLLPRAFCTRRSV